MNIYVVKRDIPQKMMRHLRSHLRSLYSAWISASWSKSKRKQLTRNKIWNIFVILLQRCCMYVKCF